jgi:GT2 family glycosyltransferase
VSEAACQFSIVVPTYGRPAELAECLASLARLDWPRDRFEVIVVDDGSPSPVTLPPSDLRSTVLRTANGGPGAARNAGAAAARGRWLAFTDDDCRPAPGWLAGFEACLRDRPDTLAGGRTVNRLAGNPWSETSQVIQDIAYAYYNADPAAPRFFASSNLAVPAERFRTLGGFLAEEMRVASEDRELCDRWRHAGFGLAFAPDALVEHVHALGLADFCRQHFRYGRGAMRYHAVRARRGSGRLRHDVGFYARFPSLARARLAALDRPRAARVAVGLLLWQVCNTAGYVWERWRT